MRRYILTGAPGAGKTAVLRQLELNGHAVVEEAATDVIALQQALGNQEPWRDPAFIANVVALQSRREHSTCAVTHDTVFFDRSPVCTLALSRYLAVAEPPALIAQIERMRAERLYERTVFFIRNLGFIRPTPARRISFADALVFERIHHEVYRELGFDLFEVPPAPLPTRAAVIQAVVESPHRPV